MLPARLKKKPKRASRWRSLAHLKFVREHACSVCGSTVAIEAAHVRVGSGAGMGQKPDDWRAVSLCKVCHLTQHQVGEPPFWDAAKLRGTDVDELIASFIAASPRNREIQQVQKEREA